MITFYPVSFPPSGHACRAGRGTGSLGIPSMRIAEVFVHKIAIVDPPLRSSYGLHQPYALRTILELKSDDGIIGLAETYGGEVQPPRSKRSSRA